MPLATSRVDPLKKTEVSVRELFDRHADFVWRVLARAGVRDADLKDALQEVFIVVASKLDRLEPDVKPTTWLYGIAVRVAANQRRKVQRKREAFGGLDGEGDSSKTAIADDRGDPEELARRAEARAKLAELLDGLSPEQRIVFELFELEELTCPAIAETLGIPLGTAYSRLRAARATLAAKVSEMSE